MRTVLFALAAAMAWPMCLHADAWARGKGAAYVHLGIATADATRAFDETGDRLPFPGRGARRVRTSLYVEAGLSEAHTLVVNVPYEHVTSRGLFNDFTTAGTGDLDLRLRATRKFGASVLALEAGAFIPLGYDQGVFPQLGTGVTEPGLNLAYGTSIRAMPGGFLSLQAGYRRRGGGISDELPWSVKAGTFLHPRAGIFAGLRGWESRGEFRDLDPTYALTAADSELLAVTGELYFRLTPRLDVNAAWSRPIAGRNSALAHEWSVGLAFHTR